MSADRTAHLISELAADLSPVRPVPQLRVAAAGLLGFGAVVVATAIAWNGGLTDATITPSWLGVSAGIALLAAAGCFGGLAAAVPGRDAAASLGAALAAGGLALGVTAAFLGIEAGVTLPLSEVPVAACFGAGVAFAVGPALLGTGLARRWWVLGPLQTATLMLLGTTAIGALAVHMTCPLSDAMHMLVAHNGMPLVATVLAIPAAVVWLRRSG
jgi:hypothetical protein